MLIARCASQLSVAQMCQSSFGIYLVAQAAGQRPDFLRCDLLLHPLDCLCQQQQRGHAAASHSGTADVPMGIVAVVPARLPIAGTPWLPGCWGAQPSFPQIDLA